MIVSLPLPGYAVASMKRTSPPTAVYASPVATPGSDVRLRTCAAEARAGRATRGRSASSTRIFSASPFAICVAALRQRSAIRALEVAHARLARVLADDRAQRASRDRELLLRQAVRLELLRDEVALRDLELLVLGVAGELDHLHAVEQRRRDRVERVRGADEQHLREVERQVEVVVAEVAVLLGVEHLEHRARRDRRGSRRPSCRSRRSASPGSSTRRRAASG